MLTPGAPIPRAAYEALHRARAVEDPVLLAGVSTDDLAGVLGASVPLTGADIERYVAALAAHRLPRPTGMLLDLGCGLGGVGHRVGCALGMRTVGTDYAETACRAARVRYGDDGVALVADFVATPLRDTCADAAVSFDGLYLAADRGAALRETCRVLRPGAPLFFTVLDSAGAAADWCRELRGAGFVPVSVTDVTDRWRRLMRARHEARWARRADIVAALGARGDATLAVTRQMLGLGGEPPLLDRLRRTELLALRTV